MSNETGNPIDVAELLARANQDLELVRELWDLFRETYPRLLDQLRESIGLCDTRSIRANAHQMKGMAANLAGYRAQGLASRIENSAKADKLDDVSTLCDQLASELRLMDSALEQLCLAPVPTHGPSKKN